MLDPVVLIQVGTIAIVLGAIAGTRWMAERSERRSMNKTPTVKFGLLETDEVDKSFWATPFDIESVHDAVREGVMFLARNPTAQFVTVYAHTEGSPYHPIFTIGRPK